MNQLRPYSLLFAIFAVGNCFAASFDCDKAKGAVEEMICNDGELFRLDEILANSYKAVLATVPDQDALKSDQRRWLSKVRKRCKEAECLSNAYQERISMLEKTWNDQFVSGGIAALKANTNRAKPFEGKWEDCQLFEGNVICSSHTLIQKGNRVCGEWEYWATYRGYSGQLQAVLHNASEASVELICGTPGSETRTDCDNNAMRHGRWEKAKGGLQICYGHLYIFKNKAVPCSALVPLGGLLYHPIKDEERKRLYDEPWVKRCLADG